MVSEDLLAQLVELSRFYGADEGFVVAGGGNTSVKVGERMFVKGSGAPLATIDESGFVEMDRGALEKLLNRELDSDRRRREEQFKEAVMGARVHPERGQRPSVEAVLHHLMPGRFVVHTHPTIVNAFACCVDGQKLVGEVLGDAVIWVAEVDPGHVLARTLRDTLGAYQKRTGKDRPRAVVMQNHGLVVAGDTPEEVREHTEWVTGMLRARMGKGETRLCEPAAKRDVVNVIAPALRGLLATGESLKVVTFDESDAVMEFAQGAAGKALALGGALTPDQIVYCKALPLWFDMEGAEQNSQAVERLRTAVQSYAQQHKTPPNVVLVRGVGLFAAGDDWGAAQTVRKVYVDAAKVVVEAKRLGGVHYMSDDLRRFIEEWEVEAYRRQVAGGRRGSGRAAGKIAVVTGAAQGFGLEIAQDLANQGAHVVLADMNAEGAGRVAEQINAGVRQGRALGLAINVTDGDSVVEALDQVVRMYGGFDVLVSNAGVLKAGSVKTQSEKDFDFVTAVNYKGYFVCVQKAAPILAIQHQVRSDYWSDIIQINSKSGLVGSNKNGAYAGSKFGGIGLTQSFALELVEDGIKVNAICPGNFFDGPLWSDPTSGLFVQYLNTGKVPGAKTIADVKKFYESKVPMGRGCTTADVMKAIYYLMEQKYETGQAIAVTGGQVMLH